MLSRDAKGNYLRWSLGSFDAPQRASPRCLVSRQTATMSPRTRWFASTTGFVVWVATMGCSTLPKPADTMAPADVLLARYEAAKGVLDEAERLRQSGRSIPISTEVELSMTWSRRLAEAACAAGVSHGEAMRQHLARTEQLLSDTQVLYDWGRCGSYEVAVARFHVAEARVMVASAPK